MSLSHALTPERESRSAWLSPELVPLERLFVELSEGNGQELPRTPVAPPERRAGHRPNDFSTTPRDGAVLIRTTADVRTALREAASATAEAAAHARSLAQLLDEALAVLTDGESTLVLVPTPSEASPREADALSPREWEVLALVAEGRTNKAIAAALFVSPNTVKTHVTSLLHKLRADTRVQLAAIATKQGLHHRAATGVAIDPVSH